jgi:long-chain acyl-CoA synthetase
MAHIAERMSSHYLGMLGGLEVTTCPDAGLLSKYLPDVRPQTFFGVPRVWEKLYAGVNAALAADKEKAQKFSEAVEAAKPIAEAGATGDLSEEQKQTWDFLGHRRAALGDLRHVRELWPNDVGSVPGEGRHRRSWVPGL